MNRIIKYESAKYPIKPFDIEIEGAFAGKNDLFFARSDGLIIADRSAIATHLAQKDGNRWRPFLEKDLEVELEAFEEEAGKSAFVYFNGMTKLGVGSRRYILLIRTDDGLYYFTHKLVVEMYLATMEDRLIEKVDESKGLISKIRPKHIDPKRLINGGLPDEYIDYTIAQQMRVVIEVAIRKNKWLPFSGEDLSKRLDELTGRLGFFPQKLIDLGYIERVGASNLYVTQKFIIHTFRTAPQSEFFLREFEI